MVRWIFGIMKFVFMIFIALVVLIVVAAQFWKKSVEQYLASQARTRLQALGEYQVAVGSIRLVYFPLSAHANDLELMDASGSKITVDRIDIGVEISKFFSRAVVGLDIDVRGGHISGIGERQPLLQLISTISNEPVSDPPAVDVVLDSVRIDGINIEGHKHGFGFQATDVGARIQVDAENVYSIVPTVGALTVFTSDLKAPITLGNLTGSVQVRGDNVDVKEVALHLNETWAALVGTLQGASLNGEAWQTINAKNLGLQEFFEGQLDAKQELSGTISNPVLTGSLSSGALGIPALPRELQPSVRSVEVRYSIQPPNYSIEKLEVRGAQTDLTLDQPLEIRSERLGGALSLRAKRISQGDITLQDVTFNLSLAGNLRTPELNASARFLPSIRKVELPIFSVISKLIGKQLSFEVAASPFPATGIQPLLAIGALTLSEEPTIDRLNVTLKQLPIGPELNVSGKADVVGPLDISKLSGTAQVQIETNRPQLRDLSPITASIIMDKGIATIEAKDPTDSLQLQAEVNTLNGEIGARARLVNLSSSSLPECSNLSGTLHYTGTLKDPLDGRGTAKLTQVTFGCGSGQIKILTPYQLTLADQAVELGNLRLSFGAQTLQISGRISREGYNARAEGRVLLAALSPLIPMIDSLGGSAAISATIEGQLSAPQLNGNVTLQNGNLSLSSAGIFLEDLTASVELTESRGNIAAFDGKFNNGRLHAYGVFDIATRNFELRSNFEDVELTSIRNADAVLSGQLLTKGPIGNLSVSGLITVDAASYERTIQARDLLSLAQIAFKITPGSTAPTPTGPVALDLKVHSSGQMFLKTNFAEAELQADLEIRGDTNTPDISGIINSTTGWFLIGKTRFEILTAQIRFRPESTLPILYIRGEGSLIGPRYQEVFITAEITGPADDPMLSFSSASGLSQKEIIALLTAPTGNASLGEYNLLSKDILFGIGSITQLDSLSLEPSVNPRTAAIEPSITATKQLTERIQLKMQSTATQGGGGATASLDYLFLPRLRFSGALEVPSNAEQQTTELNLTYQLIPQSPYLTITIVGNKALKDSDILRGARVASDSRLNQEQLAPLAQRITRLYEQQGRYETLARVDCVEWAEFCRELSITLQETAPTKIDAIEIVGDPLPAKSGQHLPALKSLATAELRKTLQQKITSDLREEGYLSARVSAKYSPQTNDGCNLHIDISRGKRLRVEVEGNIHFNRKELLSSFDFYERQLPFGRSSAPHMRESILNYYVGHGYLDAEIGLDVYDRGRETTITIYVEEGPETRVRNVRLVGSPLSENTLRRLLSDREIKDSFLLSIPTPEAQQNAVVLVTKALGEAGYPAAKVFSHLVEEGNLVITVDAGTEVVAQELQITGLPAVIPSPPPPSQPLSMPIVKQVKADLEQQLQARGFHHAVVKDTFDARSRVALLDVETGPRTVIARIKIEGLKRIERDVILRILRIKSGDAWDSRDIGEARDRLLKLGLFLRVEVLPSDPKFIESQQTMVLKVIERKLQQADIGAGANSAYGIHGFGQLTDRSFLGDGRLLSTHAAFYFDPSISDFTKVTAGGQYADPFFLNHDLEFREDVAYQRLTKSTQEFDVNRLLISSTLTKQFLQHYNFSFGHSFSREALSDVPEDAQLSNLDAGSLGLSTLSSQITYDFRDRSINTREGIVVNLNTRLSSEAIGSDANFAGLGTEFGWVIPLFFLGDRLSLANRAQAAASWGFGGTEEVPITQRYYLGGASSVRGFRQNSLGPQGADGSVLGGDRLLFLSTELRYLIEDSVTISTFVDAGNAYLRGLEENELRVATGFGARFLSPVGPVGFDIGFPLDKKNGESSVRFHFQVGASF